MFSKQLSKQLWRVRKNNSLLAAQPSNWNSVLFKRSLSAYALDKKWLIIQQDSDESTFKFPGVWLRDNCQCPNCFHQHTRSRLINWTRCKLDTQIEQVSTLTPDTITIDWSDKHKSTYTLEWLKKRDFSVKSRQNYISEVYKPTPVLWSKNDFQQVLNNFDFNNIIQKDEVLFKWLESLAKQGFAIIKDAPAEPTVPRQLANRIAFIKRTTYGEEFEVKSKDNAYNYAYLMTPLPLHTDMPYYDYKPGINILYFLTQSQSEGGANLMTDGFYIAEQMRQHYPNYFKTLVETPVDWFDIGKDSDIKYHSIQRAPVICLDVDGQYTRINHNVTKRDSHFTIPLEKVEPWYEAYDKFLQLAYAEAKEFKVQSGQAFVFNNLRMLHARTAYEDSDENMRHLIGVYVDWDLIYSRIRILKYNKI